MEKLKAKLHKQGGFTLIEMLIVVAIIAILVAVSIPLINGSLERARESTDAANERSFKAALTIAYANGKYDVKSGTPVNFETDTVYVYDAANGVVESRTNKANLKAYGKSTAHEIVDPTERKGRILYGGVDGETGTIYMKWELPATTINVFDTLKNDNNATMIHTEMFEES